MSNMTESHLANGSFGRRTFIKSAAAAGVILVGWKPTLGRGGVLQKTNVASVGVGGMGASDLGEISAHPEVAMVALCDVDRNNLKSAADKHQGAKTFVDFREMFDSMGDQIDAVSVTTPDHMHAIIAMMALNQNKHVYCQKPLAHSVHECRALRNTAMAKPELATQMGTQNASRVMKQRCMQGLRDGICGQIKEIHAWTDRPNGWWPQGNARTPGSNPVPSQLEWDLWLGTAPARPYIDKAYAPFAWRGVRDFGCGALGDMACHIVDAAFQPLDLGDPKTVICEATDCTDDQFPSTEVVKMIFPGNKTSGGEDIPFTWYDGKVTPPPSQLGLPADYVLPQNVVVIVGEKASLLVPQGGDGYKYFRKGMERNMEMPQARGGNHWHLWIDHARGGDPSLTPLSYAGKVSETLAIGALASRAPNEMLEWDATGMKFTNKPELNQYVTRKYRDGWAVAGL